jgi:Tfp pilus assembly protein PilW
MGSAMRIKTEQGFSLLELVICMLILIPIMGAAMSLFSVGARQQTSEQGSVDVNQEARAGLEMMLTEIAQAGSHGDWITTLTSGTGGTGSQTVSVASAAGLTAGDWVEIGSGATMETIQLTAVNSNGITAVFNFNHSSGDPVRLFALPYASGIIPPSGMAVNASNTGTSLRFFGDINGNATVQYVEYIYDSANNQITRSITPIAQSTKNAAIPFVRNVTPNSVQFMVNTNGLGIVTSVNVAFTVQNNSSAETQNQQTQLSSRTTIPSAFAASALIWELQAYQGFDRMPSTPSRVTAWAGL